MKYKFGILITLGAIMMLANVFHRVYFTPEVMSDIALQQMDKDNGSAPALALRAHYEAVRIMTLSSVALFVAITVLLFWSDIKKGVQKLKDGDMLLKKYMILLGLVMTLGFVGCKPVDQQVFVEAGNSDTVFNIEMEGEGEQASLDSEAYLEENLVQARRIQITYRWISTGRWYNWWSGYYKHNEQIVIVDRKPETREWTADVDSGTTAKDEAIWVESRDSVGFSTGISITARIADKDAAVKFLYNYPATADPERTIDCSDITGKDDYEVKSTSLADIMDVEIRTKVQEVFADESAKYGMDELRAKKTNLLSVLRGDELPAVLQTSTVQDENGREVETFEVVPATEAPEGYVSVVDFFAERGITITAIGMFGGFEYENPDIQTAIDDVFKEQQDKNVAIAEREAAEERKEALRLKGEGLAAEVEEAALGEAAAIQAVADAKAYELELLQVNPEMYILLKQLEIESQRLTTWDGRYPSYYIGSPLGMTSESNMNMFLPPPTITE